MTENLQSHPPCGPPRCALHSPTCSRCFSCCPLPVWAFYWQLGDFKASTDELMVHTSFKLTASAHNQAHYRLFGRGKSSPTQLQEPYTQDKLEALQCQEGGMLVSTLDHRPLLLLPTSATHLVLFVSPVPWLLLALTPPVFSSCNQQSPTCCSSSSPRSCCSQHMGINLHTRHPRKALPVLLLTVLEDAA